MVQLVHRFDYLCDHIITIEAVHLIGHTLADVDVGHEAVHREQIANFGLNSALVQQRDLLALRLIQSAHQDLLDVLLDLFVVFDDALLVALLRQFQLVHQFLHSVGLEVGVGLQ